MTQTGLRVEGLRVQLGDFALSDIELDIAPGQCCVVLGPNGAGKSVLLETLAGFYPVRSGQVLVRGRDVTRTAPERRGIALLFQDFALFPHLSVADNIRFGLKHGRGGVREAAHVEDLLRRFGLSALRDRRPNQLSGGERQKVALARAMAVEPEVFLFDEPASALDARTRAGLQETLKHFLRETGVPAVYVTHDHVEARALADQVLVLSQGKGVQAGRPADIFDRPANAFVAGFVAIDTMVPGHLVERNGNHVRFTVGGATLSAASADIGWGRDALLCIRAEYVQLTAHAPTDSGAGPNVLSATVIDAIDRGPYFRVDLDAGFRLSAYVMKHRAGELDFTPGARLWAHVPPERVHAVAYEPA